MCISERGYAERGDIIAVRVGQGWGRYRTAWGSWSGCCCQGDLPGKPSRGTFQRCITSSRSSCGAVSAQLCSSTEPTTHAHLGCVSCGGTILPYEFFGISWSASPALWRW